MNVKKEGYGAVLDVNDAIYGVLKTKQPVIVFDMSSIKLKDISRTTSSDKVESIIKTFGRVSLNTLSPFYDI